MNRLAYTALVSMAVPAFFLGAIALGNTLNMTAKPQAVVTEPGVASVMVAETGSVRDGLPMKLTRYNVTTNAGIGAFDGKPATRFCKASGYPSHQAICSYSTEPFDPDAVGRQQPVNFNTWVAVTS